MCSCWWPHTLLYAQWLMTLYVALCTMTDDVIRWFKCSGWWRYTLLYVQWLWWWRFSCVGRRTTLSGWWRYMSNITNGQLSYSPSKVIYFTYQVFKTRRWQPLHAFWFKPLHFNRGGGEGWGWGVEWMAESRDQTDLICTDVRTVWHLRFPPGIVCYT